MLGSWSLGAIRLETLIDAKTACLVNSSVEEGIMNWRMESHAVCTCGIVQLEFYLLLRIAVHTAQNLGVKLSELIEFLLELVILE